MFQYFGELTGGHPVISIPIVNNYYKSCLISWENSTWCIKEIEKVQRRIKRNQCRLAYQIPQ